jgi:hypothetical protein
VSPKKKTIEAKKLILTSLCGVSPLKVDTATPVNATASRALARPIPAHKSHPFSRLKGSFKSDTTVPNIKLKKKTQNPGRNYKQKASYHSKRLISTIAKHIFRKRLEGVEDSIKNSKNNGSCNATKKIIRKKPKQINKCSGHFLYCLLHAINIQYYKFGIGEVMVKGGMLHPYS